MKTADKEKLWDAYRQKKTQETREQLIIEYAQLVKLVAGRLSMYLGHNVEYDDLVSYGIFGLIDAIDKFDLEKNVKFETYASLRIRGAILDQIRKMDWIPRSVRQRQRKIDEAMKQIEMRTGKTASDEELAKQLGLTDEELCSWQTQLKGMTRIQQERFFNEEEYLRLKGCYQLDEALLQKAPADMPVLHPLPRIDEIKKDVDDDPRAAYFDQVHNGVYIRMAIILAVLGIPDPVTGKKVLDH